MAGKMVVAITGLPGAGTSTIAKMLAKRLKLEYFSPGEYFKSHSHAHDQSDQAMNVWKTEEGKKKSFHKSIDEMQMKKAKKGNIVICGKLSIYMLKGIANHKIWLDCSLDERAKRSSKRDGLDLEKTKKILAEREELEVKEWKKDYGIDYRKQKRMASIVIDTTELSEEETLKKILGKMLSSR